MYEMETVAADHTFHDLHIVKLLQPLIASPPLVIWPKLVVSAGVAADTLQAFGIVK